MADLKYATLDAMALVAEVATRRIVLVCGKMAARNGGRLELMPQEVEDLKRVRTVHSRMVRGDYRIDENEWARLIAVCQWLVRRHNENNNLPDREEFSPATSEWQSKTPAPFGSYGDLVNAIAVGAIDGAM